VIPQLELFTPSGAYPISAWAAELRIAVIDHLAGVFGTQQSEDLFCLECGGPVALFINPINPKLTGAIACRDPLCGWFQNISRKWLEGV